MSNVYTFFLTFFLTTFLVLIIFVTCDYLISSIVFIFSGSFESIIQKGLNFSILFTSKENWQIATGLLGFDKIINYFLGLQFDVSGRWLLIVIILGILVVLFPLENALSLKFNYKSSNPSTPDDISWIAALAFFTCFIFLLPAFFGLLSGVFSIINIF